MIRRTHGRLAAGRHGVSPGRYPPLGPACGRSSSSISILTRQDHAQGHLNRILPAGRAAHNPPVGRRQRCWWWPASRLASGSTHSAGADGQSKLQHEVFGTVVKFLAYAGALDIEKGGFPELRDPTPSRRTECAHTFRGCGHAQGREDAGLPSCAVRPGPPLPTLALMASPWSRGL